MRQLLPLCVFAGLITACGTSSTEESTEVADTTAVESMYSYSNSFEMSAPSNMEIVRNWNNAIEAGDLDLAFSFAADSMRIIGADGQEFNSTKDSIRNLANQMLEGMTNIRIDYIAGASLLSDQGDNIVLSYTDESNVDPNGNANRVIAHEVYFIEDGKIRGLSAYAQVPTEADEAPVEDYKDAYLYSNSFEIGNSATLDVVNGFLSDLESKNLASIGDYFADSVTVYFASGQYFNNVKDSLVAYINAYLQDRSFSFEHTAAVVLKRTDNNDEWALVWLNETLTEPEGESESVLHEAYMVVDNKIRVMRQFKRDVSPEED